ncbi:nitroreductase family protein [uncultured Eudoraea sp.]|uniref:nitroreductase family protein n=1 Tax=uncultured Eudoraea sp. TaxID=1035614 RepID=UPI002626316E|nr:nitroreductase family protein [uncultured Eudoraea sp.]
MADIIKDLEWRYAVKKFDSSKEIEVSKLERIKKAFILTATSYGLQPIKMVVLKNKDLQEQLVEFSYGQRQVAQASHILILCIEKKIDADYISSYFKKVKDIRGTSDSVLEPFKKELVSEFTKMDTKQIEQWAINQVYLAMGNLLTICAVEQLDACPMEGFIPERYDELLNLSSKGLASVLVLPIGYRAEDDMFSELKKVRRDMENSIIYIS